MLRTAIPPCPPDSAWERKAEGDDRARCELIAHYDYLVLKTRERVVPGVPFCIEVSDLEQEGRIALVRAVDRFDAARGVQFPSFAIAMIRGAMLEYLRREDWVPRSVRAKRKRLALAAEVLGDDATDAERAAFLEMSLEAFERLQAEARPQALLSLETIFRDECEEIYPLRLLASIADPGPGPDLLYEEARFRERLWQAVSWLPTAEREVVGEYYQEEHTMKEIAHSLDRSESRVHQIHAQAVKRLRMFLSDEEEEMSETSLATHTYTPLQEQLARTVEARGIDLSRPLTQEDREALAAACDCAVTSVGTYIARIRAERGVIVDYSPVSAPSPPGPPPSEPEMASAPIANGRGPVLVEGILAEAIPMLTEVRLHSAPEGAITDAAWDLVRAVVDLGLAHIVEPEPIREAVRGVVEAALAEQGGSRGEL